MNTKVKEIHSVHWFRLVEVGAVIIAFPMNAFIFYLLLNHHSFEFSSLFIHLFLLAYLCADIFAGIVHWAGDTIGDESTPFWGEHFVVPFRLHHVDQKLMTRISLWENLGTSCLLAISCQSILLVLFNNIEISALLNATFLFFNTLFFLTVLTNIFHRWAHMETQQLHPIILILQKYHLILNPKHHQIHHQKPFNKYFCVTNGWANFCLKQIYSLLKRNR